MNSLYRLSCLVMVCAAALVCGDDKKKVFGPEWTKDGEYYKRKVEIEASHPVDVANGVTSYHINFDNHKLYAIESDDGNHCHAGIMISQDRSVRVEVSKTEKGDTYIHRSVSNRVVYYDFDLDGIFDAYGDARGKENKLYILVNGTFVRVRDSKDGFNFAPVDKGPAPRTSLEGNTRYLYEDGKWKEE
jgi:hypothetical protein